MPSKRKIASAAATFGAALTTLYAAPELQADIVDLTFTPGALGTSFGGPQTVTINSVGGDLVGVFSQWNDSIGKTLNPGALTSVGTVAFSQSLAAGTFVGAGGPIFFGESSTGTAYVGFRSGGNVGWFSLNLGGFLGDITFLEGEFGADGETVTVGGTIPEPTSGTALAALALGAIGVRRNRKKK